MHLSHKIGMSLFCFANLFLRIFQTFQLLPEFRQNIENNITQFHATSIPSLIMLLYKSEVLSISLSS